MKPEFNKRYTTIAVYAFLVIAASICFWGLLNNFSAVGSVVSKFFKILVPFVNGFIIAYLVNPVVNTFEKWFGRMKIKNPASKKWRALSILISYIVILGAITGFCILIVPQIGESIALFALQVQDWAPKAYEFIYGFIKNTAYEQYVSDLLEKLVRSVVNIALNYSGDSISALYFGVKNVAVGIINLILGFIISIYMLYSKERFIRQGKMLVSAFLNKDRAGRVLEISTDAHGIFSKFIGAKIIDSIIVGVVCTIGMWILRLPYAELIGFIVGISNLIPYFGTWIGAIICTLMIMVVSPIKALWFVILIAVIQQVDNSIITPKIVGDSTGISPFWVMFAIIVGGGLFGIAGMLLGVPVFALIYSLFAAYIKRKAK